MPAKLTTRQTIWALIGATTLLRLAFAAGVGGYTNEAYYEAYAKNLDWSYFDHPPMVGLVSYLGLMVGRPISAAFGLRLGFVLMFAGSTWLMFRLAARFFGERAGVIAAVVLNGTVFYSLMAGMLATPDGPLLFFWLLTLDRLAATLETPEKVSTWLMMGAAWGCALLSKYHAVLLPAGFGLYLLLKPKAFRCLLMPGPYLAVALGLAMFSPVIVWNAQHEWASFAFQGTRAGGFQGFDPEMFREALVAQFLYLMPWIWVATGITLLRQIARGPFQWTVGEAFMISQALPAIVLFMSVATFKRIMPHWPLVGFLPLMVLLGKSWAERFDGFRDWQWAKLGGWLLGPPAIISLAFALHADFGLLQSKDGKLIGLFSPRKDPTVDTIRWDQIAKALEERGLLDRPNTFLFTNSWRLSAELGMAINHKQPVACYHRDSRSYTFWSKPEDWVGKDGIFVRVDDGQGDANYYQPWFEKQEELDPIPIKRRGITLETVKLFRFAKQTDPFLFGYTGEDEIPFPFKRVAFDTK